MTGTTRIARSQRLSWAYGIFTSDDPQSPARMRRACQTILNHAPSFCLSDRAKAAETLARLTTADLQDTARQIEKVTAP